MKIGNLKLVVTSKKKKEETIPRNLTPQIQMFQMKFFVF